MSIKRLQHLKEGEIIYIPYKRIKNKLDADDGLYFRDPHDHPHWITDGSQFYTPDDLKKLANDGMPKQGEIFLVTNKILGSVADPIRAVFVCNYKGKNIFTRNGFDFEVFYEFELLKQKTELTLAEVESKLGIEKGSLIII